MTDEQTKRLYGTDDAMVWAEEFCSTFNGCLIDQEESDIANLIGPGTMVGWFANAMQIAIDHDHRRRVVTAQVDQDQRITIIESPDEHSDAYVSMQLLLQMIRAHNDTRPNREMMEEHDG